MKHIADTAINSMKNAGAQKAQCVVTQSEKTEVNVESGKLTLMRTTFENSAALTAIANGKKGGAQLNSWDTDAVAKCAAEAVEIANAGQFDAAYDIAALEDGDTEFSAGLEQPEENLLSSIVALQSEILKKYPKTNYSLYLSFIKTDRLYANTNGVELTTSDGRYSLMAEVSAKDGQQVTSLNYMDCYFRKLPRNLIELNGFDEMLAQSERELGAAAIEEKFTGEVIFSPDCLYSLIQEYQQCFLGDVALIGGTSLLKDMLDKKVASELVNIRANPLNPEICGAFVTNDGFRAGGMEIITNGILRSFVLTQYGANKTGHKRSPNTGSYVEMDAGEVSLDQMVADVKKGIFIGGHISGGDPTESGAFSGVAKNSFLIKNGKITRPVQETMISGNVLEIFSNIDAVSCERRNNGVYALPWVRAGGITVS